MDRIQDWRGAVTARTDDFDELHVTLPLAATGSLSGAFRAVASDGQQWYVKSLDSCVPDNEASLVTEQIVAKIGALIGAPVCDVSLIVIGSDVLGFRAAPGRLISEGIAHASKALPHAVETRGVPTNRHRDENDIRHTGCFALYDLCFGSDEQWLYDTSSDYSTFSHDHGLYLPGTPGSWSHSALAGVLGTPHELSADTNNLSTVEAERIADCLWAIEPDEVIAILNDIPASWPVSDGTLEELGWFLFNRASDTATRLMAI